MRRPLFRTAFVLLLIIITTTSAAAQAGRREASAPQAPPRPQPAQESAPQTNADEEFELNIVERRITESDFEASTSVEVGDVRESGLNVRVGAMLRAGEIDVLLRNVRGHVRFRGNLESLLRRLGLRPAAGATNAPRED